MIKKLHYLLFFLLLSFIANSQEKEFFEASLEINFIKMPLTIEYSQFKKDSLHLLFGSPSQIDSLFKADKAYQKDDSILFQLKSIGITYRGKFNKEKDTIKGTFKQGLMKTPLTFTRKSIAFKYNRPQTPKPPFNYTIEEVTFKNPSIPKYTFHGTLTTPKKGKNFPVVILISGSGLQNRDSEIYGHKPFFLLADHLTKSGFAVFRFDDRGYGTNDTSLSNATTLDYVSDVEAAIEAMKANEKISKRHVMLLGHSEGALIAQIIASKDTTLCGVIFLAAQGISGKEVLISQLKALTKAEGITDTTIIAKRLKEQQNALENKKINKWLKTYLELDPKNYLPNITQPSLFLQGNRDLQVVAEDNLPAIRQYFGINKGNNSYKIIELSDDNHLFQRCKTGLPSEYGEIDLTLDIDVLHYIATFVREKSKIR